MSALAERPWTREEFEATYSALVDLAEGLGEDTDENVPRLYVECLIEKLSEQESELRFWERAPREKALPEHAPRVPSRISRTELILRDARDTLARTWCGPGRSRR